jgi:4-hydroxy-4-methyl-2-oxoglutarate aldolase
VDEPTIGIAELRTLAADLTAADLVDAMGRMHRHRCHILDLVSPTPGRVLLGPCVTISFFPTCAAARDPEQYTFGRLFHDAVGDDAEGRVLVLASNGHDDTSLAGGVKLSRVADHGMAGVLTDGRLRDFGELARYDAAFYCNGEATQWGGAVVTPFLANVPVVLRGVAFFPGDVVFADGSGAVVIPRVDAREVVEEAHRVNAEDRESLQQIRSESADEPYDV